VHDRLVVDETTESQEGLEPRAKRTLADAMDVSAPLER
jgi:hypothetical protein